LVDTTEDGGCITEPEAGFTPAPAAAAADEEDA